VPPALDRIVRHCLEKSPDERFQTARDVAFALEAFSGSGQATPVAAAVAPARSGAIRERLAWVTMAAALAAALVWVRARPPAPQASFAAPHRATLLLPAGVTLAPTVAPGNRLAISPDGTRRAFVGAAGGRGTTMLWVQALTEENARLVEGSEGASAPFWSPDSRIVAFRQADQLMKLDVAEAAARSAVLGSMNGSGWWGQGPSGEDVIVLSFDSGQGSILRVVPLKGGTPTNLSTPQTGVREFHTFPSLLPGGRHALFAYGRIGDMSTYGFYVLDVASRVKTRIASATSTLESPNGMYASGYLVTVRDRTISARAFDLEKLTVDSTARAVAGPVESLAIGSAAFSVSQNGVLVYQPSLTERRSRLVVVGRSGAELRTLSDDGDYSNVELSPDNSRLAVSLADPSTRTRDIWVVDVARGVRSRVTFDPSNERSAVWSQDGRSLVYTSKGLDLYASALGASVETPFIKDGLSKDPRGWSPDGKFFVYRVTGPTTGNDLWIKPRDDKQAARPLLATPFDENYAVVSPDGRWMAYASDESGTYEVYATAFPSGEGKWQISTAGGNFPRWRQDGKEVVYLSNDGRVTSVNVDPTGAALSISGATPLFEAAASPTPGSPFDMSADGKLFIVNRAIRQNAPPSLTIVYNWPQLLASR
jgi:Tol biopolymer transport system component